MLLNKCIRSDALANVRYCSTLLQTKDDILKDKSENNADYEWKNAKPFHQIPGPKPIPILGNLWRHFPHIGTYSGLQHHEINIRQHEEYGNIVAQRGLKFTNDVINLYSPEDIEKILRHEGPWPQRDVLPSIKYYRLTMRNDVFQGFGGIFTVDGEDWLKARSKLNPIIMQPRTIKLYTEPVEKVASDFVKRIKFLEKQNEKGEMPEDFDKEVNKWALESVILITLETRLGLLDSHKPMEPKIQAFLKANIEFFDFLYELDVLPSPWKYVSTPTWRKCVKSMDTLTFFVKEQLDIAMEKLKNSTKKENEMTILEKLIKKDKQLVFGTIIDIMLGGVDTTSKSIHAWFYYMASNPEVQEKLRKEVSSILPTPDSPVTAETISNMPYLKATIKETLRMAPISIFSNRKTKKDLVLAGYQVPKDTNVLLCTFAGCQKEEFFPQPKKFMPERWLRNDGTRKIDINPWIYMPFGFGPRSCVGKRLANMEMEVLLAKIARNFKMEWHHEPMHFQSKLFFGIADPLKIRVKSVEY